MVPAPYSAELRWRIIWFVILSQGQLAVRKAVSVGSLNKHDVDGSENASSENVTFRVSAIIFQLFKVIMPEKCALTNLELN